VEFGSQLLLSETRSGLIADWELVCGNPEHDTVLMKRRLDRDKAHRVTEALGDRSFDSQSARTMLAERGVANGILPRNPKMLRTRLRKERCQELCKRRGQTKRASGSSRTCFWAHRCWRRATRIRCGKWRGRRWLTISGC